MDGGGGWSPHGGVDCDIPLGDEVSRGLAPFLNPAPLYAWAAPGPSSLVASRGTNGTASRRDTDPEGQTEPAGNVNGNRWVTGRSVPTESWRMPAMRGRRERAGASGGKGGQREARGSGAGRALCHRPAAPPLPPRPAAAPRDSLADGGPRAPFPPRPPETGERQTATF